MKKIFPGLLVGLCLVVGMIAGCGQKGPLTPPPSTTSNLELVKK